MELSAIEEKAKTVLDKTPDYIWVLEVDTLTFVFHNAAAKKFIGYSPQEALQVPLERLLTPSSFKSLTQKILDALKQMDSGQSDSILVEAEVRKKNGGTVWLESRLSFYEEKSKKMVLGISRDVTRRHQAEVEQVRLLEELRETLAEKEKLLKENKVLRGLLPICANCNKIRDEHGRWHVLEDFIEAHSEAKFTHTICPPCTEKLYPDLRRPE